MATTPNFNWSTPDNTGLVKNGALDIRTLGDSIDASMADLKGGTTGQVLKKNTNTDMDFVWSADSAGMTNPMTTTGDTIYSSSGSTPARLGIGSTGQVLTVAGGVPTWATAGGGGATVLVSRTSFSNVASQTFDSVFTSTYKTYQISIESIFAATATDDLRFTFRYGTTDSGGHYGCVNMTPFNSATIQQTNSNNASFIPIAYDSGSSSFKNSSIITVQNVPGSNSYPNMTGMGFSQENSQLQYFGGYAIAAQTFTGFKLASASSNITGIVSIYGLKDA